MLNPSYAELMDIMNRDTEAGGDIKSRYTVVIAAAKRARQVIEGDKPMIDDPEISDKPLSIAVEEIEKGKIKVVPEGMGTPIHIEKNAEEELKEEIRNDLEKAAEEAEDFEDKALSDIDLSEAPESLDSLDEVENDEAFDDLKTDELDSGEISEGAAASDDEE